MTTVEDGDLLKDYAVHQSEAAFAKLVSRYLNLVYSTALRLVTQPHAAEDVAQTVFIDMANKANYLASRTVLSGWLYRSTMYAAANYLRAERRRHRRETQALEVHPPITDHESLWQALGHFLEEAMDRLQPTYQNAIILHYFEGKSMHEVGQTLAISDFAAQKRVNRAVEKLRKYFVRHGIRISSGNHLNTERSVQFADPAQDTKR